MSTQLSATDLYTLVQKIPRGRVTTYQRLAVALGFPHHARWVGQLLKRNPTPLTVPCHRVIASNGKISGYFGVAESTRQRELLVSEGIEPLVKGYLTRKELVMYEWQPER
jgi:O-6-methylguanine DNA methyltransferase